MGTSAVLADVTGDMGVTWLDSVTSPFKPIASCRVGIAEEGGQQFFHRYTCG